MTLTATQIINGEMKEKIRRSARGDSGERWYKVEGVYDIAEIGNDEVQINGLPGIGDSWSEIEKELICTEIDPEWWAFPKEDASTGGSVGGVVKVRVTYGNDDPAGGGTIVPPPKPKNETTKWSSYTTSLRGQQILYGYIPDGPINPTPINNGSGTTIEIGVVNIEVVVHYKPEYELQIGPLLELANPPKVNENDVELPPLWGAAIKLKFRPGELLYLGHQAEMVETSEGKKVLQVRHQLQAAKDFLYRWQKNDANGKATSTVIAVNPYLKDRFEGLW